jgi:hypothetical protein
MYAPVISGRVWSACQILAWLKVWKFWPAEIIGWAKNFQLGEPAEVLGVAFTQQGYVISRSVGIENLPLEG